VVPKNCVTRLSVYRRVLAILSEEGEAGVFSHELAARANVTAAQVRRDLMMVGATGSPRRGYAIGALLEQINTFMDAPQGQQMALVGLGHVGQAVIAFFSGRRLGLRIVAAFDTDPAKVDRVYHGCRCYPMAKLAEIVDDQQADVGIIAVPADEAQEVADRLVRAGVRSIVNFAPVRLKVESYVYVENVDMTVVLERAAFYARRQATAQGGVR
jgi:redox-sensing transcriptional repressor